MQAAVFPGQGSQRPGMGKEIYSRFPAARKVFDTAEEIASFPLKKICFEDREGAINQTQYTQPALFVSSLATLAALGEGFEFDAVAGHSLGEYTALVAAGIISFEDGMHAVLKRGELMSRSSETPGGMIAVIGLDEEKIENIIFPLKLKGIINIANYNSPGQIVVSGELELIKEAQKLLSKKARRLIPLAVSGAFHTKLMGRAAKQMSEVLKPIQFKEPKVAYFSNVSGKLEDDPEKIKELITKQIESPVRWIQLVENMMERGISRFIEVGEGKVLTGLIKRITKDAELVNINSVESVENFRKEE